MTKKFGNYLVYDDGRVYSINRNILLKPCKDEKGYFRIGLSNNGVAKTYKLHRLIAEMFIPKVDGKTQVNHINGIKDDNRVDNLEWCNNAENQVHAYKYLNRIPSPNKLVLDVENGIFYESATELAKVLGMNRITLMGRLNGNKKPIKRYIYV